MEQDKLSAELASPSLLGVRGAELSEECVLKNCDTCKYYGQDEEDYPCIRCDYADRWEIAPDLVRL